jgi:16S rRNA (uracil1498-N3)-methyltransferase
VTLPRLFEPGRDLRPGSTFIPDRETLHYLRKVLRLKPDDRVLVLNGQAAAAIGVLTGDAEGLGIKIEGPATGERVVTDGRRICVLVPILKGDRTELAIQKATECGATSIRTFFAGRSIPRPGSGDEGRLDRYHKVAVEACRQCGRASIPEVTVHSSVVPAVQVPDEFCLRFVLAESGTVESLARLSSAPGPVAMAIGPEGSFTDEERAILARAGFVPAGLGPRVLRAETAVMVAVVTVQTAAGDMA